MSDDDRPCPNCGRTGVRHGAFYYAIGWAYTCDPLNGGRDTSTIPPVVDIADTVTARLRNWGMADSAVARWWDAVNPWIEERPADLAAAGRWDDLHALVDRMLAARTS